VAEHGDASRSGSHRSHLLTVVKPDTTAGVESSRAVIEVEQPRAAPTLATTCAWVGALCAEAASPALRAGAGPHPKRARKPL